MWLKHPHVSPSMWLSSAFSQRLHQAWKNKTTPTGKKEASIVPGSSCTPSSRGMVASELSAPQQRQLRARRPRSYCVGSHSAPQFLRPPHIHTCVNLSYLLRAAHHSQLQETISRNPTVSYVFGYLVGWEETRGGFWNRQWWINEPIRLGDEREEGWVTEMRRSLASRHWDIITPFSYASSVCIFLSQLRG